MRGFVEHQRVGRIVQCFERARAIACTRRQKSAKGKSVFAFTARGQRRNQCRCTGNRYHAKPRSMYRHHHFGTRIGDRGRTGIGHQRDTFTLLQQVDDALRGIAFVVFVHGDQPRGNTVVTQQISCHACVFGGDHIDIFQGVDCALRDVG